jgi:hypothetical protein
LCISHPAWFVTYLWNTGATTQNITVIPPPIGQNSVYWCQISDLCGNTLIDSITICVSNLSGANVNKTNALCYGTCNGTAAAVPITTGPVSPIYYWSMPATPSVAGVSGLCAGVYRVTVTDASLCQFPKQFTITQPNAALDPANTGIQNGVYNFCSPPGNINLHAYANISNVTYAWNGASVSGPDLTVNPPIGINNYWVAITDFCGFTVFDTVSVKVSDMSNSIVDYADATCFGVCNGSAHVFNPTGVPPFTYKWLTPNQGIVTVYNPVYSNLCPGNYSLTVTDAVGCNYLSGMQIIQPDALSPSTGIVNGDVEYCGVTPPTTLSLETNANIVEVNYLWSNGSTNSFLNINPQSGEHQYSVVISNLCGTSYYDTVTVRVSSFSGLNLITDTTDCFTSCDGSINAYTYGGVAPYTYLWPAGIGSPTSPSVMNLCQGEYNVTVKDQTGCEFTQAFEIGGPGPLSDSKIVEGDIGYCGVAPPPALDIHAASNTSGVSYLWSTGSTAFMTTVFPVTGPNEYWVRFTDQCGNQYTDTILISISTLAGSTVNPVSAQCSYSCDGTATASPLNGLSPYSYHWSNGEVTSSGSVSDLCPGNYTLTIVDFSGCKSVKNFDIAAPNPISFQIIKQDYSGIYCSGFATVSNVLGGIPPYSYLWNNNVTTYNNPFLCDGLYIVTITDANGCQAVDTIRIHRLDGIGDNPATENVRLYPNPSLDGKFTLEFEGLSFKQATINVLDVTGKLLVEKQISYLSGIVNLEISDLPAGIHQVQINIDDKELITKQVVIIR